jgi:DNA ligase 1
MRALADALFASEGTRARTAKVEVLAAALRDVFANEPARLPFATRLLTGTMLPTEDDRTLGTGGALLFEAACRVTGLAAEEIGQRARRAGDLGTAIGEALALAGHDPVNKGLTLEKAESVAHLLASTGARSEKLGALTEALDACTPLEGRYLVRAILGEMRVGAKEGIVLDAIAKAFERAPEDVRCAAGLVTDVGELARLAAEDRLADARVVLGRPLGFMLATPIETARGADLTIPHAVEDKIDGIRAQAHVAPDGVQLFARGKGPVTAAFPDVTRPLLEAVKAGTLAPAILDGEIVVTTEDGRPRPFSAIQPRLKKSEPDDDLVRENPVSYLVYDLLFEGEEPLLALSFLDRRARLAQWAKNAPAPVVLHDSRPLASPEALDPEFDAARGRGHEGLILKRLDATYAAGVRGFSWLKVKKAFATLDVVIVAAERGHGRRAEVLSDYTFSVWNDGKLETVGKAYSGLTDVEIAEMTERLRAIAVGEEKRGWLPVKPEIVLEVAFDGLQKSDRHTSGYALRFPRINRIRDDKKPEDADTLDTVRKLYESQVASGHREESTAKKPEKKGGRKSGRRPDIRKKSKQLKLFDD